jgi:methyltransferase (TIGR00027 family)
VARSSVSASRTATGTAYLRAAHQLLDAPPRILEDPLAVVLLGPAAEKRIRETAARYRTPAICALRAHVVLRSRFAEDRLAAAVVSGVTQYVILGAGLDTFVLRQPQWARDLRIVEVDHAGTQEMKRARLAAAGRAMPQNAAFAAIDLEHEALESGLARYGVALDEPTFFSWLGVTMYLQQHAIDAVLRSVAAGSAGSEIVLTFVPPSSAHPSPLEQHVASLGEPWVSCFEPDEIAAKLLGVGFTRVEFLSAADATERYFSQRPMDLPVPTKHTHIVSAVR